MSWNLDPLSFGLGAIFVLIVMVVVMIILLLWVSCKAYELGYSDAKKGKWVGDKKKK